ncbi:MAG: glycerophosphodiester phosphodiesterase family protein [Candidatus Kapabacteria bacterium]|nr:glycerophosphodiester phosphodiesterase family protein [Candidatus Kapabacteria bacterium]
MESLKDFVLNNKYLIAGHRGSSGTAPENTLSSFSEAIAAGANMVEVDVQITRDNQIVAFHDARLERTSNGLGFLVEQDIDSLRSLDAGSWFNAKYNGEQIPTLDEVIELTRGKVYLNIEAKSRKFAKIDEKVYSILKRIEYYDLVDYVLFSSFDYVLLKVIKEYNPNIPTAAIRIPGDTTPASVLKKEVFCDAFVCAVEELSDDISQDCKKNKIIIGVYSVDDDKQLDIALRYDVKAIVTNFPDKINKLMIARGLIK